MGDLTDSNGKYISPGLKTTLNGINLKDENEYRLFGEYLVVKHGPERLEEGMRIFADDRKNSSAFMNKRAEELEQQYPQFAEAAKRFYKFIDDFYRTWAVDTGLISDTALPKWHERWQYYVPLLRDVGETGFMGAKRGFANQNSTIKKARGSSCLLYTSELPAYFIGAIKSNDQDELMYFNAFVDVPKAVVAMDEMFENAKTTLGVLNTKISKESAEDVHDGILDGKSDDDNGIRESKPIQKAEEKQNAGTEDRELSENVIAEDRADVQVPEREASSERPIDSGDNNNGIRERDNGNGAVSYTHLDVYKRQVYVYVIERELGYFQKYIDNNRQRNVVR